MKWKNRTSRRYFSFPFQWKIFSIVNKSASLSLITIHYYAIENATRNSPVNRFNKHTENGSGIGSSGI